MNIPLDDIQSLALSAFTTLSRTAVHRLIVADAPMARSALRALLAHLSFGPASGKRRERAVQLLVSAAGLRALDVVGVDAVDRAFAQGMAVPHRSRALGDLQENDPASWRWRDDTTHALLLTYAEDPEPDAAALAGSLAPGFVAQPLKHIFLPSDKREWFGFRDGLTRLHIDVGDGEPAPPRTELLAPGEIVLGCRDAAGITRAVPPFAWGSSLVAVRQLEQDVDGFNHYFNHQRTEVEATWLAAKAMGRWPNGMPVHGIEPVPEPPFNPAVAEAPLCFASDPDGDACPLGSHVRRANPRDGLLGLDPADSRVETGRRRILRRGRVYAPEPSDTGRGLFFIALCADLARQFEFIQQTWMNNPKHADLFGAVDPIAAGRAIVGDERRFSVPRPPTRLSLSQLPYFVTVRAGGYFLLPSRSGLRAIAGNP